MTMRFCLGTQHFQFGYFVPARVAMWGHEYKSGGLPIIRGPRDRFAVQCPGFEIRGRLTDFQRFHFRELAADTFCQANSEEDIEKHQNPEKDGTDEKKVLHGILPGLS